MKVIVRPRQCGKSKDLIEYAWTYDYHILCYNQHDACRLFSQAKALNCDIPKDRFISASSGGKLFKGMRIKGLVVDNVDLVLSSLLNILPECVSGSGDPIKLITTTGVNEHEYSEVEDYDQYQDFKTYRPNLTYVEFCKFKYGYDVNL